MSADGNDTATVIEKAVAAALAAVNSQHTQPADDALLRRSALSTALSTIGYQVAPATLATMATRGGGPPFVSFGRIPLYRWDTALAWAKARTGSPRLSTSEPIVRNHTSVEQGRYRRSKRHGLMMKDDVDGDVEDRLEE